MQNQLIGYYSLVATNIAPNTKRQGVNKIESTVTITAGEAAGVQKYEAEGKVQLEIEDVKSLLNVSRQTVMKLVRTRQLPSFKVGASVKIPIAGFKKYVAQQMANS